jgi:malate dehydrogenase (oxaloacetate-decarboxylating)(NADP+)
MTNKTLQEKNVSATSLRGIDVLNTPVLNKGTAFSIQGREKLGLVGLLPSGIESIDRQVERVLGHLEQKPSDIERYIYLTGLQDRNETLFFKVIMSDPERFLPIVCDPTVDEACWKFGHIYRRSRDRYVSLREKGRVAQVLRNSPIKDARFICVFTALPRLDSSATATK